MAWIWALVATTFFLVALTSAQEVVPSNQSFAEGAATVVLSLADRYGGTIIRTVPVWALTTDAMGSVAPDDLTLLGPLLLANASSQLQLAPENIALISCDPYSGNIQPSDVFGQAEDRNATAIVLYSTTQPSCRLGTQTRFSRVYTMNSQGDTNGLLEAVTSMGAESARIGPRYAQGGQQDTNNTSTGSQQNNNQPLGPSPSTAVAMIILYSITGIITALFLVIIITGAVRAHRHPERYGPRNGIGRPRQSRARGLARAMLETIPIVKFGDRNEEQVVKPADVELGETHQAEVVSEERDAAVHEQERGTVEAVDGTSEHPKDNTSPAETHESTAETSPPTQESGIAAAATDRTSTPPTTAESSAQGCSICTEDFQLGEDQRVLPCDHRFHPACIDPWLLNVSGTCPLCRIDLRPTTSRSSAGEEEELAPPLGRTSRRSIFGSFRPERMTREERVRALNEYRRANAEGQVEERGLRERLRRVLRVRTRRTGEREDNGASNEEASRS